MKILYISIEFSKLHMQIVESLSNSDIEVFPFTYSLKREKAMPNYKNMIHEMFPLSIFRGPICYLLRLRYIAERCYTDYKGKNIDFIYGHMLFCDGYICAYLSERLNVPYAVSVRNTDINLSFLWNNKRIYKSGLEIIKNARNLVFVNCSYEAQLLSKVPDDIQKCIIEKSTVIPNGIEKFWLDNVYRGNRIYSGEREFSVLTVGRIERNKNQLTVAKAIDCLIKEGYRISYTIVGEPKEKEYLEELRKYSFVNIISQKTKEELIRFYRFANLYAMPSFTETFGLTYVEAISQNCPIIYTKNQGFDGFFDEGKVGFCVEADSIESVKNGIAKAFEYNFGDISCYAEEFSWEVFSKKMTEVCNVKNQFEGDNK